MFDFIRKHTKITMGLLFLLIVPSFVLLGMNDHNRSGAAAVVASVDGQNITQVEWDNAHRTEIDRLRASMPTLDPKLLDSPEARYSTLERLVRDRVLAAAASKSHLQSSDARLARELQDNPQIASLRRADGTLDMERYRQLLAGQGMTPEMFEASVRSEQATRQVLVGVGATGVSAASVADTALRAYFEKRQVQLARFVPADYAVKLVPTDAELEQYYQANSAQFKATERANIEYVVLDAEAVSKTISVNEADLKTYYEQNLQRLAGGEQRRASHILINAPKTAPAAERDAAKTKAAELLAQVRKAPDSFAAVAKKNSQDTGSAANGGDLDFFSRGAMVKPFEDAAFALKKGDISDVVESDFGFHIIRLTDVKTPKQRSFEEMKPELQAELKKQQLAKKFAEAAEQFTNTVYEQPDSLKPVAERLKLEIKTAEGLTRTPNPQVAKGPLSNAKLLTALFSPDATEKKRNTEAVEVGPSQLVSARVTQYTPARTLPLAEVKEQVKARWLTARSAEAAQKEGAAKLAAWQAKPDEAALPEIVAVSRAEPKNLPLQVLDAALRADPAALPALSGVDLGSQGYVVIKVTQVLPAEARDEARTKQDRAQYAQWWSSAESLAYYKLLQDRLKVEFKVSKPRAGDLFDSSASQTSK